MSNAAVRSEWQKRFGRSDPKVICIGLNYEEHMGESGMERPKAPLLFSKFATSELDDPSDLRVQQRLNGETLQDSRTSFLIFDIPTMISYVSNVLTLEPGDLILTGTPDGVGVFRDPKVTNQAG